MRARRSGGQGRPGSAARGAGCLDRRLIRRATLTCLRLRGCVSIPTGLPVHHWCSPVASSIAPEFIAPDLSEGVTPMRVSRRVFNSPQPARTIGRVFDTPSEGTPSPDGACDRPALPADHPPPVEHRGPPAAARRPVPEQDRRADNARHRPSLAVRREQRRSRRFAISHSLAIAVWAKWRRVVGRHARQIRGELVRSDKHLSLPLGYKSGVPLLYPSIGISVRTIGRLAVR